LRIVAPINCLSNLCTRCIKRDSTPHLKERGKSLQFVKDLKGARLNGGVRIEESIAVFNHNFINLYFTANQSTMHTSYYDKVYELPFSSGCRIQNGLQTTALNPCLCTAFICKGSYISDKLRLCLK